MVNRHLQWRNVAGKDHDQQSGKCSVKSEHSTPKILKGVGPKSCVGLRKLTSGSGSMRHHFRRWIDHYRIQILNHWESLGYAGEYCHHQYKILEKWLMKIRKEITVNWNDATANLCLLQRCLSNFCLAKHCKTPAKRLKWLLKLKKCFSIILYLFII